MEMSKELYDRILEVGRRAEQIKPVDIGGVFYTDREIERVVPPDQKKPACMLVASLSALCDFALSEEYGPGGGVFVHVADCRNVTLRGKLQPGNDNVRWDYMRAMIVKDGGFKFGTYYDLEEMVINLQANFVQTAMVGQILEWLGKLANEHVVENRDDKFSQSIQVKSGITSKSKVKIENPVTLAPYRTFREIEQPESNFVLRWKSGDGGGIGCALFEADGGAWEIEAMRRIAAFIRDRLPDHVIFA